MYEEGVLAEAVREGEIQRRDDGKGREEGRSGVILNEMRYVYGKETELIS